jgi:type IV pilus assembly protein PilM
MRRGLFASSSPAVAVEIAPQRVSLAVIIQRGGRLVVTAHAAEAIPAGVVVPTLNGSNITDPGAVSAALRRIFERAGGVPRRVALAIPDSAAKVSLLRFEHVPPRAEDFEQLVRWQMRKSAPFKMEEAQVSCLPGVTSGEGGREFIVVVARQDIIREYENAVEAAGSHAGIVDVTTFNVINTVLASSAPPTSDWLLVHVTSDYISIAIVRGSDLVFFRNRSQDSDDSLADLVHQTAMYYEDRLGGGGFARVVLAGAGLLTGQQGDGSQHAERIRRTLQERLGTEVEAIDPRTTAGLTSRITAGPELLDTLAPLVGLIARAQAA